MYTCNFKHKPLETHQSGEAGIEFVPAITRVLNIYIENVNSTVVSKRANEIAPNCAVQSKAKQNGAAQV